MPLTERLCAAALHELRKRRELLEEAGVCRVTLNFKINPDSGALRLVAFEDERDQTRRPPIVTSTGATREPTNR